MMEAVIRTDALTDHQNRLRERIKEISRLTDNWDGEEGLAPIPEVVAHAYLVLKWLEARAPDSLLDLDEHDIYPTSYGTIVFDWYKDNKLVVAIEMGKTKISSLTRKGEDDWKEEVIDISLFDLNKIRSQVEVNLFTK